MFSSACFAASGSWSMTCRPARPLGDDAHRVRDDFVQFLCDVQALVRNGTTCLFLLLALEGLGALFECLQAQSPGLDGRAEEHRGSEQRAAGEHVVGLEAGGIGGKQGEEAGDDDDKRADGRTGGAVGADRYMPTRTKIGRSPSLYPRPT